MTKRTTILSALAATASLALVAALTARPARVPPAEVMEIPQGPRSEWRYETEVDEMRGTTMRIARVKGWSAASPSVSAPVWLTVSADESTSVLISSEDGSLCGGRPVVSFRIDSQPVELGDCNHLPSIQPRGTAWLTPLPFNQASGRPIPPRLATASRMIVEVPTSSGPLQVSFNVEGLQL